jgi:peptide/nickel transport system ATP-binding protein
VNGFSRPLLEVTGLSKSFVSHTLFGPSTRSQALRDVSLRVHAGGSVGLVGESGSGKSTLVRCILGLEAPDAGDIFYKGERLARGANAKGQIQPVFQNPSSSLNPRRKIANIIGEPLAVHSDMSPQQISAEVGRLLDLVSLPRDMADRYPGQLSGGQCQRVSIARAVALRPALLIADEATSALDVLVQRQIVDLLIALRAEFGLALLFVSHNLAITQLVCDQIAVMYRGELVERGPTEQVINSPSAEYTRALIRAVPSINRGAIAEAPI